MTALLLFGSGAVLGGITGVVVVAKAFGQLWREDRDAAIRKFDKAVYGDGR